MDQTSTNDTRMFWNISIGVTYSQPLPYVHLWQVPADSSNTKKLSVWRQRGGRFHFDEKPKWSLFQKQPTYSFLARDGTFPIHQVHGSIRIFSRHSNKTLCGLHETKTHQEKPSLGLLTCIAAHLSYEMPKRGWLCIGMWLTKGWSFLQALRSWDSLLSAMPDIAAHQRLPVEYKQKHLNYLTPTGPETSSTDVSANICTTCCTLYQPRVNKVTPATALNTARAAELTWRYIHTVVWTLYLPRSLVS